MELIVPDLPWKPNLATLNFALLIACGLSGVLSPLVLLPVVLPIVLELVPLLHLPPTEEWIVLDLTLKPKSVLYLLAL